MFVFIQKFMRSFDNKQISQFLYELKRLYEYKWPFFSRTLKQLGSKITTCILIRTNLKTTVQLSICAILQCTVPNHRNFLKQDSIYSAVIVSNSPSVFLPFISFVIHSMHYFLRASRRQQDEFVFSSFFSVQMFMFILFFSLFFSVLHSLSFDCYNDDNCNCPQVYLCNSCLCGRWIVFVDWTIFAGPLYLFPFVHPQGKLKFKYSLHTKLKWLNKCVLNLFCDDFI